MRLPLLSDTSFGHKGISGLTGSLSEESVVDSILRDPTNLAPEKGHQAQTNSSIYKFRFRSAF